MNESAAVGDRVRINLDGREGVVVSRLAHRYIVRLDTGQSVQTAAVTKLPATALNISTLDGKRVQAAQAAKQILGDVTVSEITELAAFLAPQTDSVAPATSSATAGAIDTSAELETARRIVRGDHSGASGINVRMDETYDDDVVEVSGYYLKPTEVRDLIAFLGAALLVHEAKRDTPF